MSGSVSAKKRLTRLAAFVMGVITALILSAGFGMSASAKSNKTVVFPLPSSGKYQVSVLAKYSGGGTHESYISKYILKTGGGGDPYCVMDIPVKKNSKVYAVADGTVYQNNDHSKKAGGYNLVIKHKDGSYSYYGHLNKKSTLKVGAKVKCGDVIGYSGNSGWIKSGGKKVHPGAHLHFEWSGHDPYCEFKEMGYDVSIMKNSGASVYPHKHEDPYVARAVNTDGSLAINSKMSAKYPIGEIPEKDICIVIPDRSSAVWYYVNYNGVEGYSYYKYLERVSDIAEPEPEPEQPSDKDDDIISWDKIWESVTGGDKETSNESDRTTGGDKEPEQPSDKDDDKFTWDKVWDTIAGKDDKPEPVPAPEPEPEPEPEPVPEPEPERTYTAYVINTDGSLVINSRPSAGYDLAEIPEGAACTVYPDKADGNWYYVSYRGTEGYSYGKYLTTTAPTTHMGTVKGTDGALAINRTPSAKTYISEIPEGATCTVFDDIRSGNWVWVEYNGVYGYSYGKYIK